MSETNKATAEELAKQKQEEFNKNKLFIIEAFLVGGYPGRFANFDRNKLEAACNSPDPKAFFEYFKLMFELSPSWTRAHELTEAELQKLAFQTASNRELKQKTGFNADVETQIRVLQLLDNINKCKDEGELRDLSGKIKSKKNFLRSDTSTYHDMEFEEGVLAMDMSAAVISFQNLQQSVHQLTGERDMLLKKLGLSVSTPPMDLKNNPRGKYFSDVFNNNTIINNVVVLYEQKQSLLMEKKYLEMRQNLVSLYCLKDEKGVYDKKAFDAYLDKKLEGKSVEEKVSELEDFEILHQVAKEATQHIQNEIDGNREEMKNEKSVKGKELKKLCAAFNEVKFEFKNTSQVLNHVNSKIEAIESKDSKKISLQNPNSIISRFKSEIKEEKLKELVVQQSKAKDEVKQKRVKPKEPETVKPTVRQ